jgi:ribosome-associated toxin RatA of RatAB toxin-antitoxin module
VGRIGAGCVTAMAFSLLVPGVQAVDDLSVQATRRGERFEVRAQAVVAAPAALVWQVLTDYARLPEFVPGLSKSVVRLREGNRVLLEQSGEARFLMFSFPIEVQLEVVEWPPDWIASRAIGGNLRRMNGRYELRPDAARGTVLLLYFGEIVPDFALPRFIGAVALRSSIEQQFVAMVSEIERRAGASRWPFD